jgi:archaellin
MTKIASLLLLSVFSSLAQAQVDLKANSVEITFKSTKNVYRYRDSSGKTKCGYYSDPDGYFYDCKGGTRIKLSKDKLVHSIQDCCSSITLSSQSKVWIIGTVKGISDNELTIDNEDAYYKINLSESQFAMVKQLKIDKKITEGGTARINLRTNF